MLCLSVFLFYTYVASVVRESLESSMYLPIHMVVNSYISDRPDDVSLLKLALGTNDDIALGADNLMT